MSGGTLSEPTAPLATRLAVIATAAMFGLTYSLSAPLIAFRLSERGLDESWIGVNAGMHAVGVLIVAPFLARLVARFGVRPLILAALLLAILVLIGFAGDPPLPLWFVLRIVLGAAAEVLFVLSETWTSQITREATRARAMAVYMAAMSLGFAAGPLLLSAVGTAGWLPFLAGAVPPLLAVALVGSPLVTSPPPAEQSHHHPLAYFRLAPLAMSTTALNAAVETAGLSFLALYAVGLGWSESASTTLVATMMGGAILLQLPIGWLGDRMDRRRLVSILALASGVGALAWPLALGSPLLAYPLVFVWGGAFVGIYTIMLTVVGSQYRGAELVGIYAAMGLTWGGGALLGPTLAGLAMDRTAHGLPLFVAAACIGFGAFAMLKPRTASVAR